MPNFTAASTDRVKKRVVRLLNARPNDLTYATSPAVAGNVNNAFGVAQEIADAVLEADALVVQQGYLAVPNHPLRADFLTLSSALASGDKIPSCPGARGKVVVSDDGSTYGDAMMADSKDTILQINALGSYVSATAFRGFYFIEENCLFHTSPYAKIYLPTFNKTTSCQAAEGHESAIVAGAIMLLKKDSTNIDFDSYERKFNALMEHIRAGQMHV